MSWQSQDVEKNEASHDDEIVNNPNEGDLAEMLTPQPRNLDTQDHNENPLQAPPR